MNILTGLTVKKIEINKPTTPMELRNIKSNDSGLSSLQYLFYYGAHCVSSSS